MKQFLIITLVLLSAAASGQNLVPNPSFEDTVQCPATDSELSAVKKWFHGTIQSADYFNSCEPSNWVSVPQNFIGYQLARTGDAYCGFYAYHSVYAPDTSYREYIEVRLIDTLTSGGLYRIEFFAALADSSNYANGIGAYLSNDSVYSGSMTNLSFTPQIETTFNNPIADKTDWIKVSGTYTALGGEKFLTIGNFKTNNSSDTIPVPNGGSMANFDYEGAYYYIDDVCVSTDSSYCANFVGENEQVTPSINIQVFPNPTTGIFTVSGAEGEMIKVYDLSGRAVLETKKEQVDMRRYSKGIYLVRAGEAIKKLVLN